MAFFAIAGAVASGVGTLMSIQAQRASAKAQAQALDYQNKVQQQQAEWNRDQLQKQANYDESIAQKNMRRERENNKREIARMRALAAGSGLTETGAVSDNLIEASERHQTEIDDLWDKASTQAHKLRGEANMAMWGADMKSGQLNYQKSSMKQASKYSIYSTAIGGLGGVASSLSKMNLASPTNPNPKQTSPLKALPYNG